MSVKPTYFCDICGAERKEVNHWIVYEPGVDGGYQMSRWEQLADSSDILDHPDTKHLCGAVCVHKIVDAWLSK